YMKQYTFFHTLVLFCILVGGAMTIWYAQGDSMLQLILGSITSVSYVAWGIIHHAIVGDLCHKVVIEYVLVGLIAIVLLATVAI
ncbi:MAG: hypothetical protein AAB960_00640, partial [Patescibacteria group bacterium]